MKQKRDVALSIVLLLITCGIYGIYWFVVLTDEVREENKNCTLPSGGLCFLLSIVTCGIYSIYWSYCVGKSISEVKVQNNLGSDDESILYLILSLFKLEIIVYALLQNDLNKLADTHNGVQAQ